MPWDPAHMPDQTGRTVAVTGATAGIGYFAAEQLAAAGAHVVLVSRSATRLERVRATLLEHVPSATVSTTVVDLASLASVREAADELSRLPRLDGVFLNGGAMNPRRGELTADGLPVAIGTHVVADVALVAGVLDRLASTATEHGTTGRIVHASTGFVRRFALEPDDALATPRLLIAAYVKAKTFTEIFAFELDRRLQAADVPVASIVSRPGVGVDAKTPQRVGVRDATTPYRRNPYTPWAQGKDSAAWSAVRALTDPHATGGQYYAPTGALRGLPVRVEPLARTAAPDAATAGRVWDQLEQLAGVQVRV
ncbi:SDR family NAD(P)-dependent oxidoreductase [Cellulomonas sp. NTE-D12]|uniref:SDR family NAD(P)-dependent oxidoreductase n=1 Tax=Cellulomonas sp. NTE-D12 TaxID=2962632 RepID=UPI00308169A4|nr:oxidoreductase [Cellulomonas sp. NTE-D12]